MAGLIAVVGLGSTGCLSDSGAEFHSEWDYHMKTAVAAFQQGDPTAGVTHFQMALDRARKNPERPNQLAYAAWHLGDVCFKHPSICAA